MNDELSQPVLSGYLRIASGFILTLAGVYYYEYSVLVVFLLLGLLVYGSKRTRPVFLIFQLVLMLATFTVVYFNGRTVSFTNIVVYSNYEYKQPGTKVFVTDEDGPKQLTLNTEVYTRMTEGNCVPVWVAKEIKYFTGRTVSEEEVICLQDIEWGITDSDINASVSNIDIEYFKETGNLERRLL